MVAPTLIDCWHVRDLHRFRAVLKGGPVEKITSNHTLSTAGPGPGPGPGPSSLGASYSKSPHSHANGQSGPCPPSEVNRRDGYGRTALHLIASSTEPWSVDYLHAILSHPSVNVNLQDWENGWTALHRALYSANLVTALILLRRSDTDTKVKDTEGLTPFDLYNSTVAGTNPIQDLSNPDSPAPIATAAKGRTLSQLYSWGTNRNFTLGLGDGDDRSLPDRVNLRKAQPSDKLLPAGKKFDRIGVRDVVMGRLHTVVLTDEKHSNVWVCGLGGNGRLGRSPQTQPTFEPLQDFREQATSVAVAQDHTIIVTASGAAYTFGLNRFCQLGYPVEQGQGIVTSSSASGKGGGTTFGANPSNVAELDVQISPRRVVGGLKKELVLGAAASKLHSVVFTADGLYTWGTNTGQLGYDRAGTPVQIYPRKVTALAAGAGIKQVAATEFGTACLMESWDVMVWHNDTHVRINFPLSRFASDIAVFRPRHVQPKSWITKLTSSGNTFAALSDMGDLFTFNIEHPSEYGGSSRQGSGQASSKIVAAQSAPRAQLVWSVRKKFTAVRDVDIGSDGSIILCTESGHVYVRSRKIDGGSSGIGGVSGKNAGKNFKFQAVPYLQRVVKVAINESGGLAAIKNDPSVPGVRIRGRTIEEALRDLLPHLKAYTMSDGGENEKGISAKMVDMRRFQSLDSDESGSDEDEDEDESRRRDEPGRSSSERHVGTALLIAEAAKRWIGFSKNSGRAETDESETEEADQGKTSDSPGFYGPHNLNPPFGCDAFLVAGGRYLPVHRVVLAARISVLRDALKEPGAKRKVPDGVHIKLVAPNVATIVLPGCSFGTALFLLHYIYSDDLPPVWIPGLGLMVDQDLRAAKIDRTQVHSQLRQLAGLLELRTLDASLRSPNVTPLHSTLRDDMRAFFAAHVAVDDVENSPFRDVELELADRKVPAHSAILRRSPFFAALFQPQWTLSRWNEQNIITIDMKHLRWEVARCVLMHLYTDMGEALFEGVDQDRSMDQFMDFVVEVLAAANELLLEKLKLVCSSLLRNRIISQNVAAVMTEADFYNAASLKEITMDYCAKSMETLLESGMLDELEHKMLKDLTQFVRKRQDERMHRTFAYDRVLALVEKHREYYDDLDIPEPSLHLIVNKVQPRKGSAGLRSPPMDAADRRRGPNGHGRKGFAASPFTSPELRPTNAYPTPSKAAGGGDPSMMFAMDDDETESPRRGSSSRVASSGSPWAPLPNIAHLSLDETVDTAVSQLQPWRAKSVEANKKAAECPTGKASPSAAASTPPVRPADGGTDLRSIMAQEEKQAARKSNATSPTGSGTATPVNRPTSVTSGFDLTPLTMASTKLSQKDRKRQQQAAAAAAASVSSKPVPAAAPSTSTPAASPWKLPAAAATSVSPEGASGHSWGTRASSGANMAGSPLRRPSINPTAPGTSLGSAADSMGPTYTPTRMQSKGATSTPARRSVSSSDSAWTTPSIVPKPTSSSSIPARASPSINASFSPSSNLHRSLHTSADSSAPLTFAQIQEQQRIAEEEEVEKVRLAATARKSFAEIIEEEKLQEERRKAELKQQEEFEKWFEAESRRVRSEKKGTTTGGGSSGGGGRSGGGSASKKGGSGAAKANKAAEGGAGKKKPQKNGSKAEGTKGPGPKPSQPKSGGQSTGGGAGSSTKGKKEVTPTNATKPSPGSTAAPAALSVHAPTFVPSFK